MKFYLKVKGRESNTRDTNQESTVAPRALSIQISQFYVLLGTLDLIAFSRIEIVELQVGASACGGESACVKSHHAYRETSRFCP